MILYFYYFICQARVCDSVYEPLEECCAAVLSALSSSSTSPNEESVGPSSLQIDSNKLTPGVHNHQCHLSYLIAKRALGMLSELAVAAGYLGQSRACASALSTICRNTVPLWDYQLQNQHQQHQQQRYQKNLQSDDLNK